MRIRFFAVCALAALAFTACTSDDPEIAAPPEAGDSTPAPPAGFDVQVADNDELGEILADTEGRTLYLFTNDTSADSTCSGACADTWPAFTLEANPIAGPGVEADLLDRNDAGQVTASGHPLYYFSGDVSPGDTNGQGRGDVWFVVSPQGEAVA